MKKVLILEDEEVIGQMYKKYLEKAGYQVSWAKSTLRLETEAGHFKPDIIILDQIIKGESRTGVDLIGPLKKRLPGADIIMTSNQSEFEIRGKALQAGAMDYLLKTETSPSELVEYLGRLRV